ncbi:MAG: bifunctional diaminohydroxyphosphoribosylaminopyrimidine deaminase/5-amino-6-(5-phosphoribosylamino)uracil reductase RibD [Actinobacteria bacterium]|nr:bifunctional diaminohydroxyphosphoribosylaminopyrimidine deaminase/5-amino-6-(5-phosphoribosylamino)uracil reductase RibD [Actinomycetota bacterium]
MRRALALAERGRGRTSPNPLVGCVVVCDDVVVGEGHHDRAGGPHAEVVALRAAGALARGATVYVTLEPCDHTGRTGPCTAALLGAGVARVVAAVADPGPIAGGGAARLRSGGVAVDVGCLGDEARRQNEHWLHAAATGRPFVVVKAAVSLDGRIAAADGTSRWLTGVQARARAHRLRADVDAVAVGSGTVLADDPWLTCRQPGHDGPQPLRVVLDRRGRTSPAHRVYDGVGPTLLVTGPGEGRVWDDPGAVAALADVEVARLDAAAGPAAVLAALWVRGVSGLLVEGGARVATSFLVAGLADKLVVHVAPLLLGAGGRSMVDAGVVATVAGAPRFRLATAERVGDDAVLTLYPSAPEPG